MTVQAFRRWLRHQIDEIDRVYSALSEEPQLVQEVAHDLTAIIEEAGRKAATLGYSVAAKPLGDLSREGLESVRAYLAVCIERTQGTTEAYLTPPQAAKLLVVAPEKIIAWIRSGELVAENTVQDRSKRAKYRIDPAEWEAFLQRRSTKATQKPKPAPRYSPQPGVKQYF